MTYRPPAAVHLLFVTVIAASVALPLGGCAREGASPPSLPSAVATANAAIVLAPAVQRQIDDLMLDTVARQHLAGLSLGIGYRGEPLFAKGYGYRNLGKRLPATPETIYNIASMSKQFTAACVLLLQQEGKLNIEDPLSKYLPGFPHGSSITIHEVLDHTSGLSDYLDIVDNKALTPAKVHAALYRLKQQFPPGSRYEYSNSNYIVAGLIVEKVSGMSYDAFLRTRILKPIELRSTTVGTSPLDLPGGSLGYTVVRGRTVAVDRKDDSATTLDYPDGNVNSTVLDLIRWDDALDGGRVIDRDMLKLMFTPSPRKADWPDGYALGVGVDSVAGHLEIAHTGGWTGFTGENATLPNDRLSVVLLTNTDTFDFGDKVDLVRRILRVLPLQAPSLR